MTTHSSRVIPLANGAVSHRGFGLVELMVSLAIGLVIIAALVALFLGTSRNNREMATSSSVIENGRFAIQLLENDLIHAGFWGTHVPKFDDQTFSDPPPDVPGAIPDPCLAYDPATWNAAYVDMLIGVPVDAREADDPTLPCTGVPIADAVPGSDVLIVRHAEMCAAGVGDCEDETADKLYIQASLCEGETPTSVFGASGTASFTLTERDCATLAEKRRFISHIYYVRDYAVTVGDGIPTLVRSEFDLVGGTLSHQTPVALIEGIDAMRVEFGVDDVSRTGAAVDNAAAVDWFDEATKTTATNRGDSIPDGPFERCTALAPCTEEQLMNATAARIYVLARSREATTGYTDTKTYTLGAGGTVGPFDDGFKRHVYSTTVRLINVSGRRERQ